MARHRLPPPALTSPRKPHLQLPCYFGIDHLGEYQKVLESQPNNGDVFEAIGWVQTYLGQWEEALTSMKTALELNPRLGRLACWTGGRNFALRNFSEGVRYHDRAIRLAPDRACPYYCKGMIYLNWDSSTARTRSLSEDRSHLGSVARPPWLPVAAPAI